METFDVHKLLDGTKRPVKAAEGIVNYYKVIKDCCNKAGIEPTEFDIFYFAYCLGNNVILKERICTQLSSEKIINKTFFGENCQ